MLDPASTLCLCWILAARQPLRIGACTLVISAHHPEAPCQGSMRDRRVSA
jgi:hypothetical protein